ncbi:hypothetical protein B0H63DRAFT_253591 [Podospora didyma]|uniref:Cyclin n=1 Tax=Podospora didyma TaxID=330526 RepID=A0AAE0N8X2_9PEZI|nr:hypothetical protein B0H63DRAFT_253591 [Podospora didyma]
MPSNLVFRPCIRLQLPPSRPFDPPSPLRLHLPCLATRCIGQGPQPQLPSVRYLEYQQNRACLADEGALQSGLRTPPADENMGTTYQVPNMASYENPHMLHHSSSTARSCLCQAETQQLQQLPTLPHPRFSISSTASSSSRCSAASSATAAAAAPSSSSRIIATGPPSTTTSGQPSRPSTPTSGGTMADEDRLLRDKNMVLHSLQIPPCISPRGGNLANFVAELTALFWFESIQVLEAAETGRALAPHASVRRVPNSARACQNFGKWVQSVLSTTQVTQNVILLALMFIYRLKVGNPDVKGRVGSEYRLLTVALMLGNKFLDDNTYTNKTWADVSGIGVGEIHVMEVEFLSNMRYSLLASKEQWEEWLAKLARFHEFVERAQQSASPSPLLIPSPTHRGFASPLPSPTGTLSLSTYSPSPTTYTAQNGAAQGWPASYAASDAVSPLALKPELQAARKRSFPEDDPTEPPAKRQGRILPPQTHVAQQQQMQQQMQQQPQQQMHQQLRQQQPMPQQYHQQQQHQQQQQQALPQAVPLHHQLPSQRPSQPSLPDQVRLSVPNLTLNTSHVMSSVPPSYPAVTYAPSQASPLSLPPLGSGVRAMSTVYSQPTTTYAPQHSIMATSGPSISSVPSMTPTMAYPPTNYSTPTKRLSPRNALTPSAHYPGSSPLVDPFSHHSMTPIGNVGSANHSPSIYLQQRNSPYRPVRHVNTLLYPPPSAFLQQYHFANHLPPAQMHYQPLGRRSDVRTGIVPEFAMASAGQHSGMPGGEHHAITPAPYQHPTQVLPNPNQGRAPYGHPMGRPISYHPQN